MTRAANRVVTDRSGRAAAELGRTEILDAAATAFARNGYTATTIDDIAERLGATKGRVYHYYRAKSEIFVDIVQTGMQDMIAAVAPIASAPDVRSSDRLWRMVHQHALLMMTRNSYQRVAVQSVEMHWMLQPSGAEEALARIIALRDEYEQLFADVVADGIGAGEFRAVDPRLATKPVLGALNWISIWYDPDRDGGDGVRGRAALDRVADEYADFIVNGLLRPVRTRP